MIEEWKSLDFIDFTRYSISNLGNLRNDQTGVSFEFLIVGGYIQNSLKNDDNKICFLKRHRLVAIAFLEEPKNDKFTVDHVDKNKLNNKVDNLRWCSKSEQNCNKNKMVSGKRRKVLQIDKETKEVIKVWDSVAHAQKELKLTHLSNVLNKTGNYNGEKAGFLWEFADTEIANFENEVWKELKTVNNKQLKNSFFLSNYGRYKQHHSGYKILTGSDSDGYKTVSLTFEDKTRKTFKLHRLVLEHFGENKPENCDIFQVNHKDGKRDNNFIENLEWVSCKENNKHRVSMKNGKITNSTSQIIIVQDKISGDKIEFDSIKITANILDIDFHYIYDYLSNKKEHPKFTFSYKNNRKENKNIPNDRKPKPVKVIFPDKSEKLFSSITDCSKQLDVSRHIIQQYLNTNKSYNSILFITN
jgi:hypothetical protein